MAEQLTKSDPPKLAQKEWGLDRLHNAPSDSLPPAAQEWKKLHKRLRELRGKLKKNASDPRWRTWYAEAERLIKRRKELRPAVLAEGFRAYKEYCTLPTRSIQDVRREERLEQMRTDPHGTAWMKEAIEGWEVFSAGLPEDF